CLAAGAEAAVLDEGRAAERDRARGAAARREGDRAHDVALLDLHREGPPLGGLALPGAWHELAQAVAEAEVHGGARTAAGAAGRRDVGEQLRSTHVARRDVEGQRQRLALARVDGQREL